MNSMSSEVLTGFLPPFKSLLCDFKELCLVFFFGGGEDFSLMYLWNIFKWSFDILINLG